MDLVLRAMYNHEAPGAKAREDRARDGVPALEVAAERLAEAAGVRLSKHERRAGGTALQWGVSIGAGALYAVLRPRLRNAGAGGGVAFGAALSLLVDEGLIPLLGLAPAPGAFPWQTHARGIIAHLIFGRVTDATLDLLERTSSA